MDAAWQCGHNDQLTSQVIDNISIANPANDDTDASSEAFSSKASQIRIELRSCIEDVSLLIIEINQVSRRPTAIKVDRLFESHGAKH